MRLFIAEKPDLAKAIVAALNGKFESHTNKGVGFYTKGDDVITWSFGHLLELYKPDDYKDEWKKWNMNDLPFDISKYEYKPIERSEKQLKEIVKLINKKEISEIMHCGDSDDEGQILIDEILEYAKNTKPVKRVLINDITPSAVQTEIAKAKNNKEYKGMSDRGFARSIADWIVGINLTRAYTCAYREKGGNDVLRVGRVMTPILSLIVDRDAENDQFTSIEHYSLSAEFDCDGETIKANLKSSEKILDKNIIEKIKTNIDGKEFKLKLVKTPKKEYPPLPYNLLILQTEAAKKFGYSPKVTLRITQELREQYKAISYNRSDCQYLPEKIWNQSKEILNTIEANLGLNVPNKDFISQANTSIKSKAFNDDNLSAHYGIIPLQSKFDFSKLSTEQQNIYKLISYRFVMQFYEPREYISYSLEFSNETTIFSASAQKNISPGFSIYQEIIEKNEETEREQLFDADKIKSETAKIKAVEIKTLQTKPRPRYTMTTLLKDLNQVAKYVKNENIKKLLIEKDKDKKGESGGIGTPATRSEMIDKLITQGFITCSNDKKQNIQSTELGKNLIAAVTPMLSNPDMTALWFEYQKSIEKGEMSKEQFLKDVLDSIKNEIENIKKASFNIAIKGVITCPKCNKGFLRRIKGGKGFFYGCSEFINGCKYSTVEKNGKPVIK